MLPPDGYDWNDHWQFAYCYEEECKCHAVAVVSGFFVLAALGEESLDLCLAQAEAEAVHSLLSCSRTCSEIAFTIMLWLRSAV